MTRKIGVIGQKINRVVDVKHKPDEPTSLTRPCLNSDSTSTVQR